MKISIEYSEIKNIKQLSIHDAKYIGDYVIRIFFNTNEDKAVDFKPFLNKAVHPSIKKYLDESLFTAYTIENGNLNWNDYDLIFPIADLYENNILKQFKA